jgi:hypothetical protein
MMLAMNDISHMLVESEHTAQCAKRRLTAAVVRQHDNKNKDDEQHKDAHAAHGAADCVPSL